MEVLYEFLGFSMVENVCAKGSLSEFSRCCGCHVIIIHLTRQLSDPRLDRI
jgi:hypothetical protein